MPSKEISEKQPSTRNPRLDISFVQQRFGNGVPVEETHERQQVSRRASRIANVIDGDLPCLQNAVLRIAVPS